MSAKTKESVEKIKRVFETVKEAAAEMQKDADTVGDNELKVKIEKVSEAAEKVVKHIEERSE